MYSKRACVNSTFFTRHTPTHIGKKRSTFGRPCAFICFQYTFVGSHATSTVAATADSSSRTVPLARPRAGQIQFICFESEKYVAYARAPTARPIAGFFLDTKKRYARNPREPVKSYFNGNVFFLFIFFFRFTNSPFFYFISFSRIWTLCDFIRCDFYVVCVSMCLRVLCVSV